MANRNRLNDATPSEELYGAESSTASTQENRVMSQDVDAIPDELDDEVSSTVPAANNGRSSSSAAGIGLEAMNAVRFDDERDELERARLDAPTGDWVKSERWKYEERVYEGDCSPGDTNPVGRTILSFSGKPDSRQANGLEYTPNLFLRISRDVRYKSDKPDQVDNAYKLFLKAKDLYLDLNNEKVQYLGQLITMLEEDSYIVRTINGDNGPIIVDVKSKTRRRR